MTMAAPAPVASAPLQQALSWQATLWSGEVSIAERARFEQWLAADPVHAHAWAQVQQTEDRLQALTLTGTAAASALRATSAASRGSRRAVLGMAGLLGAASVAALAVRQTPQWQLATADHSTARGQRRDIALPDGSRLTLGSATAVNLRYGAAERLVLLHAGEVFITTAADAQAPGHAFLVQTTEGRVQAIGTQFISGVYSLDDTDHALVGDGGAALTGAAASFFWSNRSTFSFSFGKQVRPPRMAHGAWRSRQFPEPSDEKDTPMPTTTTAAHPQAHRPRLALTPLHHAVLLAGMAGVLSPARAQAQTQAAAIRHDIPAGTLDQVPTRFATHAGILLSIDGALTAGKTSPGLQGSYSAQGGLKALLVGSGLEAVADSTSRGYVLRKAACSSTPPASAPAEGATLPQVTVAAQATRTHEETGVRCGPQPQAKGTMAGHSQSTGHHNPGLVTPVLVDAATGTVTDERPMPWYMKALFLSQPLHFGDYGGLSLKIIWALLTLITIVVLGSGIFLWLSKSSNARTRAPAFPTVGRR